MKIISPAMHGIIDYCLVLFLWIAPTTFVLPEHTAKYVYLLGFAHLFITACTNNNAGIFRFISMKLHGTIELALSVIVLILCFTELRYDERDKAFFLTFGVVLLVLYLVTDYTGGLSSPKRFRGSARLRGARTIS
ncbi:hypothetical protein DYU05_12750 [Mucilaginibacter terrenus]|uniref:Uncharacterized protein n=1 Tax=Mucilaginibacter terrenus TaxID=2482727 RepID=A0A3E2NPT7_9SPHI|nr:hypothetical protein [Mucilaginibacter terrenus]RFZ83016.1 hypothetical protein DYU05_12750 [Mucilaginibacter terrenus]